MRTRDGRCPPKGLAAALAGVALGVVLLRAAPVAAWDPLQKAPRQAQKAGQLLAQGEAEQAVEAYALAQALDPDRPEYRLGLGEALFAKGDLEGALDQFLAAAAVDSERAESRQRALYNAGNVALAAKDPARALQLYEQALLAAPADSDLVQNLELAQRMLEQEKQEKQPKPDQKNQKQNDQQQKNPQQKDQDQQKQGQQNQDQQSQDQQKQGQQNQDQQKQDQRNQGQPKRNRQDQDRPSPPETTSSPPDSTRQPSARPDSNSLAPPDSSVSKMLMSRQEALRLLDALDHDEQELLRSIQRRLRGDPRRSTHAW